MLPALAAAHPADMTQLLIRVEPQAVQLRFAMNLAAINKLHPLDQNADGQIDFTEVQAAAPAVQRFLEGNTMLALDDEDSVLPAHSAFDCLWPQAESYRVQSPDLAQFPVEIRFEIKKPAQEVWLAFQWFEQLGELHSVEAVFQQPGMQDTPVIFDASEPDFLYDTTVAEPLAESAAQQTAATGSAPHWSLLLLLALVMLGLAFWAKRQPPARHQ
jgi:hypothetical protein